MSEQDVVLESKATPEVRAKAERLGWIPPERFKGDPERFTDAQEYIERGETVLPIIRATNARLETEVGVLRSEAAQTKAALATAQKALDEIEERHSVETTKAVERAMTDLKGRLAKASEDGDHALVAELTGLMVDLKAAKETPKKEPAPAADLPAVPTEVMQELRDWNADNPWFGKDARRTGLAQGIAKELRDSGSKLTGRAFFDKVAEEVEATLAPVAEPSSKVEGARGSGGARSGGPKSFASLPADAKAACDADASKFVGKGKKFENIEAWRKRYADIYYQE